MGAYRRYIQRTKEEHHSEAVHVPPPTPEQAEELIERARQAEIYRQSFINHYRNRGCAEKRRQQ